MLNAKRYIYFVPVGGLGNRLRSIESAIRFAQEKNAELEIGWYQDWGMGCKFSDIFKPLQYKVLEEAGLRRYILDRPRKKNFFVPAIYEKLKFDVLLGEKVVGHEWFGTPIEENARRIWMASSHAFFQDEEADYSIFHPIEELQKQIDAVVCTFPKQVVGMQIRRTDFFITKQISPTINFEKAIEQLDYNTSIYLASDDESEKLFFKKKYGNRVITRESILERGSKRGIQDAVIEMYILSATNKIYGSKNSSFGQIAAKIGNVEFLKV